jgi:hypothetical protein
MGVLSNEDVGVPSDTQAAQGETVARSDEIVVQPWRFRLKFKRPLESDGQNSAPSRDAKKARKERN